MDKLESKSPPFCYVCSNLLQNGPI